MRTCLFSMNETDLRGAAARRARRTRSSSRSSATPSGARSSSTTSTTPGSCSRRGRCRGSADETRSTRRSSSSSTGCAPLGAGARAARRDAAGRVAAEPGAAARSTCRRSTARRWTATRCAPPTPRRASRCGWPAASPPARSRAAALEPGTAARDLDRRGAPAGRRRDPAVRAAPTSATGTVAPDARARARHARPLPRRGPARGRRARARAGDRLTLPRISALASAGVGEVAVAPPPARCDLLVTGSGAAAARRAARAGPDPRVQRADGPPARRPRRAPSSSTTA